MNRHAPGSQPEPPPPMAPPATDGPLDILSRAAASLNRGPAPATALRNAMMLLLEETQALRCLIYLHSTRDTLHLEAGCSNLGGRIRTEDKISRGVAGTVLHTGTPLLLNSDASSAATGLINAVIAVPLRFNGTLSGVLHIDRLADRFRFSKTHLAFACAFTEIIALALRHHPLSGQAPRSAARSSAPDPFTTIVGTSQPLRAVIDQARRVLDHDVPVLILGESGTGKELLARAIHVGGPESHKPFIPLNCSAVPGDLLESELFGHVRGAFTGAGTDRRGLLEEANGGTLFLDEIGDLAPATQAKLLRVLQEGEFRRVGENRIRRSTFRLITATNRELKCEVARERFRLDLYYRIAVVLLRIPPLRERAGDLPLLVDHFCRRFNRRGGFRVTSVDRPAMNALAGHQWPGNVRELENTIHSALVMMSGDTVLGLKHLPSSVTLPFAGKEMESGDPLTCDLPLRQARERFDRRYVVTTLERHNGNRTRTASALGISRQALLKMVKRLGLAAVDPPSAARC